MPVPAGGIAASKSSTKRGNSLMRLAFTFSIARNQRPGVEPQNPAIDSDARHFSEANIFQECSRTDLKKLSGLQRGENLIQVNNLER
jgi:hypothetical protein